MNIDDETWRAILAWERARDMCPLCWASPYDAHSETKWTDQQPDGPRVVEGPCPMGELVATIERLSA